MPRLWIFGQSGDASQEDPVKVPKQPANDVINDKSPLSVDGSFSSLVNSYKSSSECEKNKDQVLSTRTIFYAVSLPGNKMNGKVKPLVFLDKKAALETLTKNEGARFKVFHNHEDAVNFASLPVEAICRTPKVELTSSPPVFDTERSTGIVSEKASQFRGPKSQDTVKLRKIIANGEVTAFKEIVWSNPRYLITAVDTPTIFQEGFRYNALHIAAKSKQPELCEEIIKTVQNPDFVKLLYPDDTEASIVQRMSHILDLYLNMPDKGLCETPLHFAAKFGCLKCVEILASQSACDTKIRNKYGLQAKEVICDRCPAAGTELKQKIEEALQEKYYVPVLRSEDNSVQPSVGKPFCKENSELPQRANCASPYSSALSVMAIAGPMSPEQADAFYRNLKTPPANFSRAHYNELHKIRLCDTEKGLERIARNLAHSFKTPWTEFWPSLNAWCDLTSPEGLMILEQHLRRQYEKVRSKQEVSAGSDYLHQNHLNGSYDFAHSTPCKPSPSVGGSSNETNSMCTLFERFHIHSPPSRLNISSRLLQKSDEGNHLKLRRYLDFSDPEYDAIPASHKQNSFKHLINGEKSVVQGSFATNAMNNNIPLIKVSFEKKDAKATQINGLLSNKPDFSFGDSSFHHLGLNQLYAFPSLDYNADSKCISELLKTDSAHQFLFSVNNVILCILKVFSVIALNPDFVSSKKVHEVVQDYLLPEIKCLVLSSEDIYQDISEIHSFIARRVYQEMPIHFLEHEKNIIFRLLKSYLECYFSLNILEEDDAVEFSLNSVFWEHLRCILWCFSALTTGNVTEIRQCSCNWAYQDTHFKRFHMFGDWNSNPIKNDAVEDFNSSLSSVNEDSEDDDYFTPPASPQSDSEDEPVTPEEGLEVYIEGECPSKADLDILRAIESVMIDPVKYPHISQWKHMIMLMDKKTVESWRTPLAIRKQRSSLSENSMTSPFSLETSTRAKSCMSSDIVKSGRAKFNLFDDSYVFE